MPELALTRGLPASGKTTYARLWVDRDRRNRVRINRDDFRMMMFGVAWTGDEGDEAAVTEAQLAAVGNLLRLGRSVIVDDTNLNDEVLAALGRVGIKLGATLRIVDHFLAVPVSTCIDNDAVRLVRGERSVGVDVIQRMAARYARLLREYAEVSRSS